MIGVFTLACAACAGDAAERSSGESGRTLTILYAGSNEWLFGPAHDDAPKFLLFLPLVSREASSCTEPSDPGLAESWKRSEDWRVWTVWLREDVRWHDGVPVTAEDIVFSVRLWQHPDVGWYGAAPVDSVEVLDRRTLRFVLRRPGDWPLNGWDAFHPEHLLEHLDSEGFLNWDFWTRPVGNGPFRYVRHVPETMVELEANPDYPFGTPRIERVVIQFRTGGDSGLLELEAGNVDLLPGVEPLDALKIKDDPRFRTYYTRQGASVWVVWNHRDRRLSDPRVRRALTHAIDRRVLGRTLALPEELPLTDAPFTPCQLDAGELLPAWPHDPAEARRLLEEAGWGGGRPLGFTLTFSPRHERVAVFLQAELRKVGVAVELQMLEDGLVHRRFQAGEFEAMIPRTGGAERIAAGAASPVGAPDPRLADLMARAMAEPAPALRVDAYRAMGERYREVLPATFLHLRAGVLIAHRRVRGLGKPGRILERQGWRWPFGGLEDLWLEDEP